MSVLSGTEGCMIAASTSASHHEIGSEPLVLEAAHGLFVVATILRRHCLLILRSAKLDRDHFTVWVMLETWI